MNKSEYITLLASSQQIDSDNISGLAALVDAHPYFQSARALWLKGLKSKGSFRYNDVLKVTAAHTANRDVLFQYITSETFAQNEISRQVLKHNLATNEMEVIIAEDVSERVSVALNKEMKAELKKAEAILDPALFEKKAAEVQQILDSATIDLRSGDSKENKTRKNDTSTALSNQRRHTKRNIELDQPLEFKQKDMHSFSEWLKLSQAKPIEREKIVRDKTPEKKKEVRLSRLERIDSFIAKPIKLKPPAKNTPQKNLAEPFTKSSDSLMTETLARVYIQQKNYKKAIQAYKILILRNPEKSGFFADQIRAVKKLIKE
ncbi:hypothetical protein [Patiriisocius sp. Uisw_017]|uniref:hypothetical protein n=1 Tax=Patiriisocius sp. Uisw_017 TaxID=3230968 RepID=UPI0039EB7665